MSIGAVVPVYNRRENLELLLLSLEQQTTDDFVVIVADDGSTDDTRKTVEDRSRREPWQRRLFWVGCGPSRGVRTGRARNIGAANLPADASLVVMLDSDLVLQSGAMRGFADLHRTYPGLVILGLVDWLPPVDREAVADAISTLDISGLRSRVPRGIPKRLEGTFTGPELRAGLFDGFGDMPTGLRPEWALPLNSAWPVDVYWSIGGFDEGMVGYGYQDMEFGARAMNAGVQCLLRPELWALHVWHPKPPKAMLENQRNLDVYLRRHGPNRLIETDVDWTLWFHYHAERGGTVVQHDGHLWAFNNTRDRRLSLPDTSWLARLGHCSHSVRDIELEELIVADDLGVASEQPATA